MPRNQLQKQGGGEGGGGKHIQSLKCLNYVINYRRMQWFVGTFD